MRTEYLSSTLTQSQSLLWIGQEMNPESPMYNMVMTYEIHGRISISHFRTAFHNLVQQNDALRSVFIQENNITLQQYLPTIEYDLEYIDFSAEEIPSETYKKWESQRIGHLFNLKQCLFDCALLKLSDERFIWYINQHHLITDGWSTSIIFSKMSALYAKALENDKSISEDTSSFREYSLYCKEIIESGNTEKASKYWKHKLSNLPSVPSLYNKKDTSLKTDSERIHIKLGLERSSRIREFANQKGIKGWTLDSALYNIFLTVYCSFLYRVTGQERLVIGSPTHNRLTQKLKNTIGLFIETFPLEVKIKEKDTFLTLFQKIQAESNNFLKHAQIGISNSALSRSFNTFFNYLNTSNSKFNGIPVSTNWVHPGHTDPRHHIRLHVHDFDNTGEIQLYFDLNTHLFNSEERNLVPQHFLSLFDAFLQNPSQKIDSVSIITQAELQKIKSWNDTTVLYPENETLLSKYKLQVQRTPNDIALRFGNKSLTYKELDDESNRIAHFLQKQNLKRNDIVTVSMERSLEMMICIYGIIKAGLAYLPVDITIPSDRLKFIIDDAQSRVLFYNHSNISDSILNTINCYHTSTLESALTEFDNSPVEAVIQPDDLAYVIYTSGSTGQPKGVKCHHKGICNRLNWMDGDHPLTKADVLLQKTPITFDVSLWELFWPLQKGATLIIEKPEGHKNPEGLIATIQKYKVSVIHFVPSMFNIFIQTEGAENCKSLQKVFCSGESLSAKSVKEAYTKLDANIYNLYGPTEASVDVTSWLCEKNSDSQSIPIGRPVANTQLYIVDKQMNLAPIGIPGELYISGTQVAQGYLHRDSLTQERFLKDIFSGDSESKMYKTGDLVKYLQDGVIEYLGRIDNQIKLRGQRIELGEIEKTLERHQAISQAIVGLDPQNNLVSHYTGEEIRPSLVTAFLESFLPLYMIPSFFVHVQQFEFLSNGKIDRKKLITKYPVTAIEEKISDSLPQNEIEEIIHKAWKDVMKIEKIGIHENFIRIGGNSLIAISITSRLKEGLELELSINDVFNYPTIQLYAKQVENLITHLLYES